MFNEDGEKIDLRRWLNTFRLLDLTGQKCSLSQIAAQVAGQTRAESCSIFFTNLQDKLVLAATTFEPLVEYIGKGVYSRGEGLTGWVFMHGEELHIKDVHSKDQLAQYHNLMWLNKYNDTNMHKAFAAMPIIASNFVLGVVRISSRQNDFSDAELDTLRFFCRHMATELIRVSSLPTRGWSTEELYRPAEIRIELLRKINDHVIAHLAEHPENLHRLNHRMFEELIAELLSAEGWKTELTLATHDGGYDIRAVRLDDNIGEVLLLVEAKKYRSDRPVGVDIVRDLYAVKQMKHATKAMLATTSYVSRDAKAVFHDFMFELDFREYEDIVSWLQKYYRRV